jgi:hypothetical protein
LIRPLWTLTWMFYSNRLKCSNKKRVEKRQWQNVFFKVFFVHIFRVLVETLVAVPSKRHRRLHQKKLTRRNDE